MKLTIKTLDQQTFHVDFDDTKTVWELKTYLHHIKEIGAVNPEQQQLVYAGRVLENQNLLKSYSIDERKFLVVLSKPLSSSSGSGKGEPIPGSIRSVTSHNDQPGPSSTPPRANQKQAKEKQSRNTTNQSAAAPPPDVVPIAPLTHNQIRNTLASYQPPQHVEADNILIQNIVSMGYPEVDVRRALRASFNNPDLAIEYLIDGMPQEFPELFAGPQQASAANPVDPLAFMRNDPRFNEMRDVIRQRPELLTQILTTIAETNPPLLAVIRDHQEEFIQLLNGAPNPSQTIAALSEQDRDAVERLSALGFPRDVVVQAYLSCDKNEEETADFLCRHMEDN